MIPPPEKRHSMMVRPEKDLCMSIADLKKKLEDVGLTAHCSFAAPSGKSPVPNWLHDPAEEAENIRRSSVYCRTYPDLGVEMESREIGGGGEAVQLGWNDSEQEEHGTGKEKREAGERRKGNGKTRAELDEEDYKRRVLEDAIRAREMGHSPNVALDQMRTEHWASWREDEDRNVDEAPGADSSDEGGVDLKVDLERGCRARRGSKAAAEKVPVDERFKAVEKESEDIEIRKLKAEICRLEEEVAKLKKKPLESGNDGKPYRLHEIGCLWDSKPGHFVPELDVPGHAFVDTPQRSEPMENPTLVRQIMDEKAGIRPRGSTLDRVSTGKVIPLVDAPTEKVPKINLSI